jgi:hypothetical protein
VQAASRVIGGVVPSPHLPPHLLSCWWLLSLSPLFVPVHSVRRDDAHPGRCSSARRSMAACLLGGLRLQLPSLWCIWSASSSFRSCSGPLLLSRSRFFSPPVSISFASGVRLWFPPQIFVFVLTPARSAHVCDAGALMDLG